ncbi:hypothetical protein ACQVP2_27175 [Methylobacterium aquaticum]|jgi:hypothetical protein|uniref:Uncharacterized protein n=1 Tax=Methylobacterium aquaticum TaxID=270351 RepID=A0A0J6T128_9HYPH|nr:hypothetical protein [Methylobacterium aquaticum]KMO41155.1 hypothetical protein VP06_01365 [Methylobacterium aquaticum]
MTIVSAERIAARRQSAEIAAWTGSGEAERMAAMTDAEVAALIEIEDAEAAALAVRDKARDAARLARHGLGHDQIVRATGRGTHHDSHGVEAIDLAGDWRVVAIDGATGRIHLAPASGQGQYALVRPEQIVR